LISRVRGELIVRDLERVEVLTPGGVAYELHIPTTVFERLPRLGEQVTLRTYHLVREDAELLFGFLDETERTVFTRLLAINGVGPRLALAILSAMSVDALVRAVRERSVAVLTAVSGVGKKTAERIALELTGKLDDIATTPGDGGPRGAGVDEALRALAALGVPAAEADRAVRAAVREDGGMAAPEIIRRALAGMK
jgi:holliday junction DNA helicase RuvA